MVRLMVRMECLVNREANEGGFAKGGKGGSFDQMVTGYETNVGVKGLRMTKGNRTREKDDDVAQQKHMANAKFMGYNCETDMIWQIFGGLAIHTDYGGPGEPAWQQTNKGSPVDCQKVLLLVPRILFITISFISGWPL